jgi:hypothetical protein
LFISSLRKVGQFSFKCCPLAQEISSGIHYLPCLGRLLVALPPLSVFFVFPAFVHWELGAECLVLCPAPILQGRYSVSPTLPLSLLDYTLLFMFFSFAGVGRFSLPNGCTGLCSWGVGRGVAHVVWCSPGSFYQFTQACLKQVVGRIGANFFQCIIAWWGFPQARGSGCCRVWFWLMLCLLHDGRRIREGKKRKRKTVWGVPFP